MSFLILRPAELRAPETLVLPDGRKRLTRFFGVAQTGVLPPELNFDWGSLDAGEAPMGWTGLRLTARQMTDNIAPKGKDSQPILQLIYEQIDESAETPVGGRTTTQLEDGREALVDNWVQFSTGAYVPQTVGTTTAVGDSVAYLQKEESVDDGTVRRITRTYVHGGVIATDEQIKNNGALSIKTITSVKAVPATPSGYTLIGLPTQNPNGLPIYTYTFAKGGGQIDIDIQEKDNGALHIATIRYLTPPGTSSQPTSDPLSGGIIIDTQHAEQDGNRLWTVVWAKGVGEIERNTELRNNGALALVTIRQLTAPSTSSQPTSDPLSGGIIISTQKSEQDGYRLWNVVWAKGAGEISRISEYRVSNDDGATGVTLITIRYLSDPSVSSNPITPPVGYATTQSQFEDEAGYRVWTGQYANGTGTIDSTVELRNKGKLVIYSITAINAVPSTPSATISGTVVLIRSEVKREIRLEGVLVYDYVWAEGNGVIKDSIETRNDGLREETIVSLGTRVAPSAGVVIRDDSEESEGVTRYTVTAMQNASGSDPTSGTFSFERYVPFTYPGRLKAFSETNSGQVFLDVFKSPPVQTDVLATVTISYQTSGSLGSLPSTRWQPLEGATIKAQWVGADNDASNLVESWRDYRSVSETTVTITGSGVAPNDSIFGRLIYGGTVARITVTGGPPDPASTWTLDAHLDYAFTSTVGTRYYRKTTVVATIAAQTALPV